MRFFALHPEVAGGWGPNTIADTEVFPPKIERLHYEFDGWLGDELLESFPCFIVSEGVAVALTFEGMTGFELQPVEVSLSEQFRDSYGERPLPRFHWVRVVGRAGQEDLGLSPDHKLVVSEPCLAILQRGRLSHCDVEEYVAP